MLSNIYLSYLLDAKVNFLLGRSAYETGRYEIALAAFERVSVLDPLNSRNDLELGRTQYKLEMYEDARISFKKVLNNPNIPETVRTNIELFLAKVEDKLEKSFFITNMRAGFIYDTNVNYGPYNDIPSVTTSKGGLSTELQGNLTHIYDIGEKDGLELRNQALLYNRNYFESDLKDYNISYLSYAPGLIYEDYKTIYELNLMLDRMWLDGKDYMSAVSLMPAITHKLDISNRLIGSLKLTNKDFKKTGESDKDARAYEATFAYQKLFANSYFTIKAILATQSKKRGTRVDVDYNSYAIQGDYATQFYPTYVAKVNMKLKTKKYDDFSTIFSNKRKDDSYGVGVNISKKFTSDIYLEGRVDYERVFSNQNVYSYDKASYGIYLNMTF